MDQPQDETPPQEVPEEVPVVVKKRAPRKKKVTDTSPTASTPLPPPSALGECEVCAEPFNLSSREKVTCEFADCQYTACKQCIRTYLLSTTADPHCMNCKKEWNMKFLVAQLNRSYVNTEFREHRAKLLLERELSRMPETMEKATRHKLARDEDTKIEALESQIVELQNQMIKLRGRISEHKGVKNNYLYNDSHKKDDEASRRQFIMPCPSNDCRGFLSTQYKCEMCDNYTCKDCHVVVGKSLKDSQHVCNADDKQSAELIKKDTRPCPKCGIRIFKISGCDQMWCTSCQTAFSWNTGKIDSGIVHNPHFFQYQRTGQAANVNHANAMCGAPTSWHQVRVYCGAVPRDQLGKLEEIFYALQHMNHLRLSVQAQIEELMNTEPMRINYILQDIEQEELRKNMIERDSKRHKLQQIYNIFDLVWTVTRDIYARLMETVKKHEPVETFVQELETLRTYANNEFAYISATFNQTTPKLTPLFSVKSQKCSMTDMGMIKARRSKQDNVVLESST
jgi:hypothetical protein